MPRYVTVTGSQASELLYLCKHCGLKATALVIAKGSVATSSSLLSRPDDPTAMLAENLREQSRQMIRMAPCPHCRERDDVAVRVFRNKQILVGSILAAATSAALLIFSGSNQVFLAGGLLALALWYAFTQWDLWSRSPKRVHFDFIEPAPEPARLPAARVVRGEAAAAAPRPARAVVIEEVVAVEPTPFGDGPSLLK